MNLIVCEAICFHFKCFSLLILKLVDFVTVCRSLDECNSMLKVSRGLTGVYHHCGCQLLR